MNIMSGYGERYAEATEHVRQPESLRGVIIERIPAGKQYPGMVTATVGHRVFKTVGVWTDEEMKAAVRAKIEASL